MHHENRAQILIVIIVSIVAAASIAMTLIHSGEKTDHYGNALSAIEYADVEIIRPEEDKIGGMIICGDGDCQAETCESCPEDCGTCDTTSYIIPIRGIMFGLEDSDVTPEFLNFIRTTLKQERINTILFSVEYNYKYASHPEITENKLSYDNVKQIVAACRDANIKCIPLFNAFGHQSKEYSQEPKALLREHPEYDASASWFVDYPMSWNPYYPRLQETVNDLISELIGVWEIDTVHIGMDEIITMPRTGTPYYTNQSRAEMFAYQFEMLHKYLKEKDLKTWVWGDRLLDGSTWQLGGWEDDNLETHHAIDAISSDETTIIDWHYESSPETAAYFASKGFDVVSAPWDDTNIAISQLNMQLGAPESIAPHMKGILLTTWRSSSEFMNAYNYGSQVNCNIYNCATGGGGDEVCIDGHCFDMTAYRVAKTFKKIMLAIRQADAGHYSPNSIFTIQAPDFYANDARYELGTRFRTKVDGQITRVRIYASAMEGGQHEVRIWHYSDNNLVAGPYYWNFAPGNAGWKEYPLPSPIGISANEDYIVSVSNSNDKYYSVAAQGFNQPIFNGYLMTYAASGIYSSELGTMPFLKTENSNYFRDIVFLPNDNYHLSR